MVLIHFSVQVCLKKCPDDTYIYKENEDVSDKVICAGDRPKDKNDLKQKIKDGVCAQWYLPTVSGKSYREPFTINEVLLIFLLNCNMYYLAKTQVHMCY